MARLMLFFTLMVHLAISSAQAENMIADVKEEAVYVDLRYQGEEIFIFGAIDPKLSEAGALGIGVKILGEETSAVLYEQKRKWGLWQSVPVLEISEIPSFAIAAQSVEFPSNAEKNLEFAREALSPTTENPEQIANFARLAAMQSRYVRHDEAILLQNYQLFEARLALPTIIHEGDYQLVVELSVDEEILSTQTRVISVQKTGLGHALAELSEGLSWVYGLLSLSIAMALGLGASVFFRRIFNDLL